MGCANYSGGAATATQGQHLPGSNDSFADLEKLVLASCTKAALHWNKELKSAWAALEKEAKTLKLPDKDAQACVSEVAVATHRKDTKALASVLAKCRLRAGGLTPSGNKAITDSVESPFAVVEGAFRFPVKQVLHCAEIASLRKDVLDAIAKADIPRIKQLCLAMKGLGEPCALEEALAAELKERAATSGLPQQSRRDIGGDWKAYVKREVGSDGGENQRANLETSAKEEMPATLSASAEDASRLRILDLPMDAMPTERELRVAFKRAALAWHPDRPHNHGKIDEAQATDRFRQAREAYEHLLSRYEKESADQKKNT